jgi:hypothetical protein
MWEYAPADQSSQRSLRQVLLKLETGEIGNGRGGPDGTAEKAAGKNA